jgi:hypothetical protein
MIHVLELFLGGLLNLGAAALVPIGFFLWLIWFFLRLIIGNPIKSHRKYKKLAQGEKNARKSLNEDLIKLGINPEEFNKKPFHERMNFWYSISDEELEAHGIDTSNYELR